jgi:copper(I)-binding protein
VIWRSRRTAGPRRLAVLAIAALVPVLAGCEAGASAPTQHWHQPTDGAAAVHNNVAIKNVFVLGAPLGAKLTAGHSAGLFLALFNQGSPDRLLSITAPGTAKSVTLPGGTVRLASQQTVLLTGPAPKVILQDLTRPLTGGTTVRLVLNFENAASVTMVVPVMPRAQYYSTFAPAPSPTPTAKHGTASPGATPTPSASPTPSTAP